MEIQKEKYPYEIITLPSEGYFYDEKNPLASGTIKLKLPTAKHEDILTSRNLITKGIVIDEFLKSLLVDDINYQDLLLGDKNGLIVASRILLYGSGYTTKVKCPSCGEENIKTFNLADIETKEIDLKDLLKGNNEFDFQLPHSKINIKYKLLTQKDEEDIQVYLKKMKKNLKSVDPEITTRISYVITSIDGETNKAKIMRFVSEEMPTRDAYALREHLVNVTPGMDTDVQFDCEYCGHSSTMSLPMDYNFFWPSGKLQG